MFRWLLFTACLSICGGLPAANPIDVILAKDHASRGLSPARTVDDARFLRRITLDLAGRVPSLSELKSFMDQPDRDRAIERLLGSEEFVQYWSELWTITLAGRATGERVDRETLRRWLADRIRANTAFDQVAFDLISATGVTALDGPVNFLVANREDPVTQVSRVFLGVQLDCARCHDHPFDRWTQDDYESMRRFFEPIQLEEVSGGLRLSDAVADRDPDDENLPRFLTGARPRTTAWRKNFALMTIRVKPFSRAIGNRVWQLLLGRGIVDPVDGLSENDQPSVPELHDFLGQHLRDTEFDLRALVRLICSSDAYARQDYGKNSNINQVEQAHCYEAFAARKPRAMLPEQWVLSHRVVTQVSLANAMDAIEEEATFDLVAVNENAVQLVGQSAVSVGGTDPIELQRTSQGLLQELATPSVARVNDLEEMFLATLQREPTAEEFETLATVIGQDVLYALLHCNEFVFNH
ncbi:MAG: DUF1549 domain-containing protein [Planctomycetota bacterium]